MYENAVAYQAALQDALAAAMNQLREAMRNVHKIESSLGKADFELGKTRYILRKSGYGELLGKPENHHTNLNSVKFIRIYFL